MVQCFSLECPTPHNWIRNKKEMLNDNSNVFYLIHINEKEKRIKSAVDSC